MNLCSPVNPYQPLHVKLQAAQQPQTFVSEAPAVPLPVPPGLPDSQKPDSPTAIPQDSTSFMEWLEKGVNGTNTVGSIITLPNEAIKLADNMSDAAKVLSKYDDLLVPLKSRPLAALGSRAVAGTLRVLEESTTLAKTARVVMQAPVIGHLTQPKVADFVSNKVLPTANALAAGISIYDHSQRFQKAKATGNTAAQVVSGVQIGLNAVSAVTGYMKGTAQTVSAVAGLGSLALDIGSWATGVGYIKQD